jgi:hypothetical protein
MLLPPLEFFTLYQDDMNYRQQFFLAMLAGFCSVGTVALSRYTRPILTSIALLSPISIIWGLIQSFALMQSFGLSVQIGLGGAFVTLSFLCIAVTINKQGSPKATLLLTQTEED